MRRSSDQISANWGGVNGSLPAGRERWFVGGGRPSSKRRGLREIKILYSVCGGENTVMLYVIRCICFVKIWEVLKNIALLQSDSTLLENFNFNFWKFKFQLIMGEIAQPQLFTKNISPKLILEHLKGIYRFVFTKYIST